MAKLDWEGPHPEEPGKKYYSHRISGPNYDSRVNIGIATLVSFGVSLRKAQQDPYALDRSLLVLAGIDTMDLLDDFIPVYVAQPPLNRIAGDVMGDRKYNHARRN